MKFVVYRDTFIKMTQDVSFSSQNVIACVASKYHYVSQGLLSF